MDLDFDVLNFDTIDKIIAQLSYQLYQNLKRQNPSPYMYYLNMDEPIVVGSSPESFVKVKGDTVVTNPIAGTIKRGKNEAEDIENEKLLKRVHIAQLPLVFQFLKFPSH